MTNVYPQLLQKENLPSPHNCIGNGHHVRILYYPPFPTPQTNPTALLPATIHTQPIRLVGWFAFFFLFPLQLVVTSTKMPAFINSSEIITPPIITHKAVSSFNTPFPLVLILGEQLIFPPTNVPIRSRHLSSVRASSRII